MPTTDLPLTSSANEVVHTMEPSAEHMASKHTPTCGRAHVSLSKRRRSDEALLSRKRIKCAEQQQLPAPLDQPPQPRSFQQCFDGLPPELRNMIFDYTFSAGPVHQHITRDYQTPSTLLVSRRSRTKFARSYYGLTTFYCPGQQMMRRWIRSLTREHRAHIQIIHLQLDDISEKRGAPVKTKGATGATIEKREDSNSSKPRKIDHANYVLAGRAQAKLFFSRGNKKAKVHVKPGVTKVNVKFDYCEEKWTADPSRELKEWKRWKKQEVWRLYSKWMGAKNGRGGEETVEEQRAMQETAGATCLPGCAERPGGGMMMGRGVAQTSRRGSSTVLDLCPDLRLC